MTGGKGRNFHRGYHGSQSRGSSKWKPKQSPLTHFLCFPLVNAASRPQLEESLQRFQNLISTSTPPNQSRSESKQIVNQSQLPAKAIRPLDTLHLTLGVMSLDSEDKVQRAIKLLKSLDPMQMIIDDIQQKQKNLGDKVTPIGPQHYSPPNEVIPSSAVSVKQRESSQSVINANPNLTCDMAPALPSSSPIIISLTSLHSMHHPKSTSILYANPYDSTDRLLPLGQNLRTIFEENGYMTKDTRPLKLHATIVNMIYARPGGRDNSRNQTKHQTVGAVKAEDPTNSTSTTVMGTIGPVALENLTNDDEDGCDAGVAVNEQEGEEQVSKQEGCSNSHERNARAPMRFDATALLEQFKDFVWARDFRVEKVAICKMGAKKIFGERGKVVGEEYEEVAYVELP